MSISPERRAMLVAMQEHKRARRMMLADDVSLLWESDETVDHQIREMQAMEDDAEALASVLSGYEDIRPRTDRLTATAMVEVTDAGRIKQRLGYYAGLEHAFFVSDGIHKVPATIVGDHGTPDATTAVTYLAFALPPGFDRKAARLIVEHPRLSVEALLPAAVTA